MTQASLRELIVQERAAGKPDTETLVLLRRSKLKPPGGFYCWMLEPPSPEIGHGRRRLGLPALRQTREPGAMSTALAELVLDFEQHGRDLPRLLGSGTPRRILVATTEARMLHDRPSLQTVAALSGLVRGTLKASRSRISGLREAMDAVGQGPATPPIELDDEIAWLRRYWRARSPAQVRAWEAAAGCWQLHRLIEDESTRLPDILAAMPARAELARLWGAGRRGECRAPRHGPSPRRRPAGVGRGGARMRREMLRRAKERT